MKKSLLLMSLMLATLAGGWTLTPTAASADPGRAGHERGFEEGRHLQRMAVVLDLSDAQQAQIKAILQSERQTVAPLQKSLQASREALRQAAQADTFDEAAVRSIAAGEAATRTELIVARARTQNRIHALLTPAQRAKAEKLRPRHRDGRGPRDRGPAPDGADM
jgi:Spy/CpxP family protein refolding chaperone